MLHYAPFIITVFITILGGLMASICIISLMVHRLDSDDIASIWFLLILSLFLVIPGGAIWCHVDWHSEIVEKYISVSDTLQQKRAQAKEMNLDSRIEAKFLESYVQDSIDWHHYMIETVIDR